MSSSVSSRSAVRIDGEAPERVTAPIRWGEPASGTEASADFLPPVSWDQLEAVLAAMAVSPDRAIMVRHLLAGARRDADRLPVDETVRDILCIAAAAVEPAGRPAAGSG